MKHFFTLLSHEVRMLLVSASTYIAATLFLGVMGFLFTGILESYSKAPQETSPAQVFFQSFWLPVFFMVPLLTMKSLAEERRLGTIETLLTTPVTTTEVVLGKYGAAYFLYLLLWSSTGGFFYILYRFAGDAHFLDPGPLIGGYLFIAVSGLLFIGGPTDLIDRPTVYYKAARLLYHKARKINRAGGYFPIWGTCLGFEQVRTCVCR